MRVELKGINTVRRKLATGVTATYFYHRDSGTRLEGKPGSETFQLSLAAAKSKASDRTRGTLAGLIRQYEGTKQWRRLAESTKLEYRRILTFWDARYGSVPLAGLEEKEFRQDVLAWHDQFSAEKPREADNRVTILARVLSWGASDGPLKVNVLDTFERAYRSDRSEMIWLPEHVDAFMEVAPFEMQVALVLALHTGQRQGDVLRMAWSAYDGEAISVRQGKTGRYVRVKCTKALKQTLDATPRRATVILATKTGLAFKKRYFAEQWAASCTVAKIEGLHFHDLRGTAVTMLFEAGCTVAEVAAITGHTLRTAQEILDRYLARTSILANSAIAKLENVLSRARPVALGAKA